MKLYDDEAEEKRVWEIRESGLGATANVPGMPLSWPGWEDAAVPPEKVGDYLRDFRRLLDEHGLIASLYGHFGQGCIHCRISFDLFSHDGIKNYMKFIHRAADLVVSYRGSFSAEHGDGQSKAIFLPKMYGHELMDAFRQFKTLWDPDWKMNPGKVLDPYLPDENLRLGAEYNPWQPDTHFRFPTDNGSFSRATLRCVGVGKCRRTHDAFMCPSFLATREELHTTRGRAHMLFEMFRGDLITDGWKSDEVLQALELCLSCKGCKTDCPVNVDIPTYKAEFLSHHYKGRLRPLAAYSMGLIGIWGRIGTRMPKVANFFGHAPLVRSLTKALGGIAAEREMPVFAEQGFTAWYNATGRRKKRGGDQVFLYPDLFNDCFYPDVLKAALAVLEHYGFSVIVPEQLPPTVRPPLDYGMLEYTKKKIMQAMEQLHPYLAEAIPIVFLEPSTVAVFRDELPSLFPEHKDGQRTTGSSYLLSEFVEERKLDLPRLSGKVIFHGHCHQKAVLNVAAARSMLKRLGLEFQEPEPGCCGMAGSFGFERGHYDISMKIAEENLLPAVRTSAASVYIVADGFSCRTQIQQGTGRMPLHTAELLQLALRGSE